MDKPSPTVFYLLQTPWNYESENIWSWVESFSNEILLVLRFYLCFLVFKLFELKGKFLGFY